MGVLLDGGRQQEGGSSADPWVDLACEGGGTGLSNLGCILNPIPGQPSITIGCSDLQQQFCWHRSE